MGTGDFIYKTQKNRISYNCKAWGYQNFISLIGKLEREGIKVVLIGGKKEQEEMEKEGIKVTDTNLVCNLIGKTSMVQSLSILGLSNLVIGCDTGMMHCAAALNIPTLSIFGATNPEVAKPFSERAYIITGSADIAMLKLIVRGTVQFQLCVRSEGVFHPFQWKMFIEKQLPF